MRSLIRIQVIDPANALPPRSNRAEYDPAIAAAFTKIGFDPRVFHAGGSLPPQEELELSSDVAYIFEGVPDPTKTEEKKHLIMLGYTSEGQAKFVICSINQNVLHIRVREDLFDKLRRSCREICTSIWRHAAREGRRFGSSGEVRFAVRGPIEVMEPGHGHPTILGHIVRHPFSIVVNTYPGESVLAFITLAISAILFWWTPNCAPWLTAVIAHLKPFPPAYIQGALERTYSAFLVTFFVTVIDLSSKYREFRRVRPILWNAGIEPNRTIPPAPG
jgi:hypothetical protein